MGIPESELYFEGGVNGKQFPDTLRGDVLAYRRVNKFPYLGDVNLQNQPVQCLRS